MVESGHYKEETTLEKALGYESDWWVWRSMNIPAEINYRWDSISYLCPKTTVRMNSDNIVEPLIIQGVWQSAKDTVGLDVNYLPVEAPIAQQQLHLVYSSPSLGHVQWPGGTLGHLPKRHPGALRRKTWHEREFALLFLIFDENRLGIWRKMWKLMGPRIQAVLTCRMRLSWRAIKCMVCERNLSHFQRNPYWFHGGIFDRPSTTEGNVISERSGRWNEDTLKKCLVLQYYL